MERRQWILGFALSAVWLVIVVGGRMLIGNDEPTQMYSVVVAWIALLAMSVVYRPTWLAVGLFLVAAAAALMIDVGAGTQVLYHDPPQTLSVGMIELLGLFLALWVTPLLVGGAVNLIRRKR